MMLATLAFTDGQGSCPFCGKSVGTSSFDSGNVQWVSNGKTVTYKCVLCALADEPVRKGHGEIIAAYADGSPSVRIRRIDGQWSIDPPTSVFLYALGKHDDCQLRYRAFTNRESAERYVDAHPGLSKHIEYLTLPQFLKKTEL
jgi:hypothetical protein